MELSADLLQSRLDQIERLRRHLTFRISRMSKLLEVDGSLRLADTGINLTSYRIMLVTSIFGAISVSDLSRVMVIDRAQVSRTANELIARGLLEARDDRRSRRKKLLAMTDAGRRIFDEVRGRFDDRQERLEQLLSGDELQGLWRSIDKISAFLEETFEPG